MSKSNAEALRANIGSGSSQRTNVGSGSSQRSKTGSLGSRTKPKTIGNYTLGEGIGKGGFGTVYKGLNTETGDFVAIKQVSLANIPKEELSSIMMEIDLLKKLKHTNIVKYLGFIKTKDHLNIILEYVDCGSLASIIKKFGSFPESLVAIYISQVLIGLVYLHDQGVIHRDIKGANILTSSQGHVKLADFGVATACDREAEKNAVVGTPYWMAPEVIEMSGLNPASDIWSVGCTVIELLTGAPPYYDLAPMPALFRIVQDEYPPLPEGVSSALNDFLLRCFQKDPNLRITAHDLLHHPWIQNPNNPRRGRVLSWGDVSFREVMVRTIEIRESNGQCLAERLANIDTQDQQQGPRHRSGEKPRSPQEALHVTLDEPASEEDEPRQKGDGEGEVPKPLDRRREQRRVKLAQSKPRMDAPWSPEDVSHIAPPKFHAKKPSFATNIRVSNSSQPARYGSLPGTPPSSGGTPRRSPAASKECSDDDEAHIPSAVPVSRLQPPSQSSHSLLRQPQEVKRRLAVLPDSRAVSDPSIQKATRPSCSPNLRQWSEQDDMSFADLDDEPTPVRHFAPAGPPVPTPFRPVEPQPLYPATDKNQSRSSSVPSVDDLEEEDWDQDLDVQKEGRLVQRSTDTRQRQDHGPSVDFQSPGAASHLHPASRGGHSRGASLDESCFTRTQWEADTKLHRRTPAKDVSFNTPDSRPQHSRGASFDEASFSRLEVQGAHDVRRRRPSFHENEIESRRCRAAGSPFGRGPNASPTNSISFLSGDGKSSKRSHHSGSELSKYAEEDDTNFDDLIDDAGPKDLGQQFQKQRQAPGPRLIRPDDLRYFDPLLRAPVQLMKREQERLVQFQDGEERYDDLMGDDFDELEADDDEEQEVSEKFSTGPSAVDFSRKLKEKLNKDWDASAALSRKDSKENTLVVDPFTDIVEDEILEESAREGAHDRDQYALQSAEILKLIAMLQPHSSEEVVISACDRLVAIFKEHPAQKSHLITHRGVIPIMEMLEVQNPNIVHRILLVVNQIIEDNAEFKENLCLVGAIPAVIKFATPEQPPHLRFQAAQFVKQMCQTTAGSTLSLQMFIACRGLPVLVGLLETSFAENRSIVILAVDAIWKVFELQSPTPKNDFCRLFAKCALLERLVLTMLSITQERNNAHKTTSVPSTPTTASRPPPPLDLHSPRPSINRSSSGASAKDTLWSPLLSTPLAEAEYDEYIEKIANLFLLFSHADSVVKSYMSTPDVLRALMRVLGSPLPPAILVKLLKCIKNLSMDPNTLDSLQMAGAIPKLSLFLAPREGPFVTEMHNQVLNAMFNLCKINRTRQEIAAVAGIIPHLQYFITKNSPLKQFALPVFCDLAHASKRARQELWKHNGVQFYMDLLSQDYWQVNAIESIAVWLADEHQRVEDMLLSEQNIKQFVYLFKTANNASFVRVLDPFLKILQVAKFVNEALGRTELVSVLITRLKHLDARVRVNLLKILMILFESAPDVREFVSKNKLLDLVREIVAEDKAVLVKEMAAKLVVAFEKH